MKPNQDPLDDPVLQEILDDFMDANTGEPILVDIEASEEAIAKLLKWRSDYVMGLIKEIKTDWSVDNAGDKIMTVLLQQYLDDQLELEDIRAKNERGK